MGQRHRLLAGAVSASLLLAPAITARATSSPSSINGRAHSGQTVAPHVMRFGTRASHTIARPNLKKPLLAKNPAAFNAAKAKAAQLQQGSQGRWTAPARPVVPGSLAPNSATLETLTSFPAMGLEQAVADMGRDQVGEPADTQVAAGPTQVLEVVNANMSAWTKAGARLGTQDLAIFFSIPPSYLFTDPNVLFDAQSQRWFVSGMAFDASFDSRTYVAASQTSDATGTWYVYEVQRLSSVLQDQPSTGNNDDKIVMAWSDFEAPCSPTCTYRGAEIWALQKSDMVAGLTLQLDGSGPDLSKFALIPARSTSTTLSEYVAYNNADQTNLVQNQAGPTIGLIAVTGTPAGNGIQGTLAFTEVADPAIQATTLPPDAQQPGGASTLQTDDDRLGTVVWQNGKLWTAANEACPGSPGTGCVRVIQLDTTSYTVAQLELGGGPGDFLYYSAIALDNAGDAIITYNESNSGLSPSLVATWIHSDGTVAAPVGIAVGSAAVDTKVCGGTNRWGDYSGAAQDPVDPSDVWVAGGYGANSVDPCDWRTAIGRLTLSAPTVTGFTPTQATKAGGTSVVITGTDFSPNGTTVTFPGGMAASITVQSPNQLTAVTPSNIGSGTSVAAITVSTPDGSGSSSTSFKFVPFSFNPSPIAPKGTLAASSSRTVTLTPAIGGPTQAYLSFVPAVGGGSACVVTTGGPTTCPTPLPATAAVPYPPDANGHILLQYTAPGGLATNGTDTIHVQDTATGTPPTNTLDDAYAFTPVVTTLATLFDPIAPEGDLVAGLSTSVTLTATDAAHQPVPGTTVYVSFVPTAGGAAASIQNGALTNVAAPFTTDGNGQIAIVYTTPQTLPAAGGTDTIHANTANGTASAQDTYTFPPVTTFYFAEGFTANGFKEILSLLMPNESGTLIIDYYTQGGHSRGFAFLTAGVVEPVDINAAVGANQEVSMKVTLPGPGVAERTLHFNFGSWYGSTDTVGVTAPSTNWYFAEGSTLSFFSEYLTLQNPNSGPVSTTLQYFTDSGLTPTKTLTLPANSRTTVAVFDGDTTNPGTACLISGGNAVNCGVGRGIAGVSVRITATGSSIIAERPFYVNNFSFGSGPIRDGHDAFGATSPAMQWNFAEGTTLGGFNEYLTLQNPNPMPTSAQLHYFTGPGVAPAVKTLTLPANSRVTVEVFRGDLTTNTNCSPSGGTCGVGPGVVGVSTQVTADQAIVVERPMYMYFNFGSGPVAGAHVVVGATSLAQLFGFSWASTLTADNDYLTIQNPGGSIANITATYYTDTGVAVQHFSVAPSSRHTVELFQSAEGAGPGIYPLGIVIQSDQRVMVEKPTYSWNTATYGATDTLGYSPATGGF